MVGAEAVHFPVFDDVVGGDVPDELGGVFVVGAQVDAEVVFGFDGVAVDAAVGAGVVCADVDAFYATANIALVFVFACGDRVACEPFYEFVVDAHAGRDA